MKVSGRQSVEFKKIRERKFESVGFCLESRGVSGDRRELLPGGPTSHKSVRPPTPVQPPEWEEAIRF